MKVVSGKLFSLAALSFAGIPRFSCSVSKKVAHRAVDRNRAKRRARAAFLNVASKARGLYLVTIKKPALAAPFSSLEEELRMLLHMLNT